MSDLWALDSQEAVAQQRSQSIPLSHLSIELGHLYFEESAQGAEGFERYFGRIRPWIEASTSILRSRLGSPRPRISTCFLIDDYFYRFSTPDELLPILIRAAESQNVTIDYVARESACVVADGIPLAELVLSHLVPDPSPGTTGVRPPATVSGWLCNGRRSPNVTDAEAMAPAGRGWEPPVENGALNNHSIFVDVQLWDETDGRRRWSSPYLSAIWQLLRLGLLRFDGAPVATPVTVGQLPDQWDRLPAIVQVNPRAQPFSAYSTFSILGQRFLATEHATRTILQQISIDHAAADQVASRGRAEGMQIPGEIYRRIEYLYASDQP